MNMLEQVQKMQADMQAAQQALESAVVEATVGGGVVKRPSTVQGALRAISSTRVSSTPWMSRHSRSRGRRGTEAARQAKVLQREKLGAATSGLDLGSLGLGGLDGLLG